MDTQVQIHEGSLYRERAPSSKFPRIIRVKKIGEMGPNTYVFFFAENPAAQSAHPNGGFMPVESFLTLWAPVEPQQDGHATK